MKNQSQDKQETGSRNSGTKKQSNQPDYEDKPWQAPQYGQKNTTLPAGQKDNAQDDSEGGSCGCGSSDEKSKKKNTPVTSATDI